MPAANTPSQPHVQPGTHRAQAPSHLPTFSPSHGKQRQAFPWLLLLPACIGLLLVDAFPFAYAIAISFQQRIQGQPVDLWIGLSNYRTVMNDDAFWRSLTITIKWTLASVAGQLLVGTALALLVDGLRRGRRFFSTLLLLPWATPLVVAALTCRWLLQPDLSPLAHWISPTWFGLPAHHDWLGDPSTALTAVVAAHVWKYYGFVMIVVLARLRSVPHELHEAASIDGANRVTRFAHITLPQLRSVLGITALLMLIWTFNTFDLVFLMAQDNPAANLLSIEVWRRFYGSFNFGLAAATAVIMFLMLFAIGAIYAWKANSSRDG